MRSVTTDAAPQPAGHYSQALVHDGTVYVAGQLPITPDGRKLGDRPVEEQTEQALRNVQAVLRAAGSDLDRLLSVTVYVSDIGLWSRVNAVYARVLGDHRPARAVVPTTALHHGLLVEIQAIAAAARSGSDTP
ncbi:MAG: RidA family protein [Gemmatimonadales bacterium]|nr:RidA family protein [Gemmatimonadales bacterium]